MRFIHFLLLLIFFSCHAFAQIRLPKLVSDNMVLQRDQPVTIWGWATPKEKVTVTLKGKSSSTVTRADGKWEIQLPAQPAGTGFEMLVKGKNEIRIKNIAFGDVWLCNGQSNMVINMERVKERFVDDIANAHYPDIRNFFIPTLTDLEGPQQDFPRAEWKAAANPEDVLSFGAVSYFFARDLYDQYKVPIGVINSSVGGTPIEAWISEDGYLDFADIQKIIAQNKDTSYIKSVKQADLKNAPKQPKVNDLGLTEHWESETYQLKGWRSFNIPGYWEDQGLKSLDGVVWFRRDFEVPESWIGKPVKLYMGRIVDADQMFVNGKSIGNVTYQYPPRRYEIPAGLLKAGKNTFVIRVTNYAEKGGFVPDKPYFMTANDQQIDLKGTWQYKIGQVFQPKKTDSRQAPFVAQNQPAALYNAMIAPVLPMKLKGFLWYQGETNVDNPDAYKALLPALINDRRRLWNDENLPFLVVQLPNFQDIDFTPAESNMALLREAQNKALALKNTAVTVTLDLGEWNDIHPLNKKDIGKRLALSARNLAYGDKHVVHSGPTLKSQIIEGDKIVLTFDNVADGIKSNDGESLRWFAIADHDKKFVWASAKILGKYQIELTSETIKTPKYIRYAWQDNPEGINFYNSAKLPAAPFRTDDEHK